VSRAYGTIPHSHLLQNDGRGRFIDATRTVAPALDQVGMVSSSAWVDTDGDRRPELVVVGEWMPVRVFGLDGGRLVDRTERAGLAGSEGWWNSVAAEDLNGDGRPDLVLGNLGLNSYLRTTATEPARLYVHDFGDNGAIEQLLTFPKQDGVSYPLAGRDDLVRLVPSLRQKYPSYAAFGASRIEDVFPAAELRQASVLTARRFATSIALNRGDGTFALRALPTEAQLAPTYASLADDFDADGHVDLLLAGNFHGVPPLLGRYDASYGVLLRGSGDGRFVAVDRRDSGLLIEGQARALARLRDASGARLIAVARNDAPLLFLHPLRSPSARPVAAR
jgi:hypothetical protein